MNWKLVELVVAIALLIALITDITLTKIRQSDCRIERMVMSDCLEQLNKPIQCSNGTWWSTNYSGGLHG